MTPAKAAPSTPNFNLFNNSAPGVSDSLSNFVGPPIQSPKAPASSTSPTKTKSVNPVAPAPCAYLLIFSGVLKYLPAALAALVALVKPEAILNAGAPGTPRFTISSVIFPRAVAPAASSKGFILSKYSSTASALSLSTPRSNRVAPNVVIPSAILKRPEGIAANIERAQPASSPPSHSIVSPSEVAPILFCAFHSSIVAIGYS